MVTLKYHEAEDILKAKYKAMYSNDDPTKPLSYYEAIILAIQDAYRRGRASVPHEEILF